MEKGIEKVAKLQEATKKGKADWSKDLSDVLKEVTLASDYKGKQVDVDETRPWRMRKVSAVEGLLSKVESGETPGAQLRTLVSAYEEARKQAQAELEKEREEVERMVEKRAKGEC